MPIRINLLAEAQALEELRQKDPVKRIVLAGICLVMLILAYSSSLLVKTMVAKGEVTRLDQDLEANKNQYSEILENQNKLIAAQQKLAALHRLSTNRFLNGTLLNTLMQETVDDVQLTALKVTHTYVQTPEVKRKKGEKTAPKPATSVEKIVLLLNAQDSSATAGDGVNRYQAELANSEYFKKMLASKDDIRLISLNPPQTDPQGKTFVHFTLEARLPEKTR